MDAATVRRRSARDLLADAALFVVAVMFGLVTAAFRLDSGVLAGPPWLFVLDQVAGALGCLALWWRRRWPVGLAVVLVLLSTFSELVAGAMLVALFTVAVHRPPRTSVAVLALSLVSAVGYVLLRPEPEVPAVVLFLFGVTLQGAAVGWGVVVHQRRRLVESLLDRAERAETEAGLRAERA
ncbi:MAG: sensor histidine kinase, partial [Pseudonocardia sp.]|nr:sensor histidine kinase [Pseudonocardia sp.]